MDPFFHAGRRGHAFHENGDSRKPGGRKLPGVTLSRDESHIRNHFRFPSAKNDPFFPHLRNLFLRLRNPFLRLRNGAPAHAYRLGVRTALTASSVRDCTPSFSMMRLT